MGSYFGIWNTFGIFSKKYVFELIKELYAKSEIPRGNNSLFITLIPKVDNPTKIKDYRPISLI